MQFCLDKEMKCPESGQLLFQVVNSRLKLKYMSIKCHHTVIVIYCQYSVLTTVSLLSHYCGVQLTIKPITVKTTVELL